MKMKIPHFMLLLLLACGCAQGKPLPYAQITTNVIEGLGIPGYLEIGMRMDGIPAQIPDAACEPDSRASIFWWFGETWRKHAPWEKPATYTLIAPSVGATVIERNPTDQIAQIHFHAQKKYDWPYFTGTLSSGLAFSGTNTVSLAEVVARYGTPLHTLSHPSVTNTTSITQAMQPLRQQEAILASGESLLMTYDTGQPYRLHYPERGIYFNILNGEVHSFRILRKVEPSVAGHPPQGAPPPQR